VHRLLPVLLALAACLHAAPAPEPACHALLVGGLPGPAVYSRRYADWLTRFHALLTKKAKVPEANVVVLSGDPAFKAPFVRGKATAEAIRKAIADLAARTQPHDQFLLLLIGHGALADTMPSLILPGDDITAQDLAAALEPIRARNQVVLNFTASSGDAVQHLSASDRVVVAATSPTEVTEPVFAEFFLRGIETERADGEGTPTAGVLDKTITLLEACNWAANQTAMWIVRQKTTEEGWRVDGRETAEAFKKLYVGKPGEPATRKLSPASGVDKPDEPVRLRPEGGTIDGYWRGRRIVAEHATLEDCGEDKGATPLGSEGYRPLAGTRPGEPGWLARRVVLGRPALLNPKPNHAK